MLRVLIKVQEVDCFACGGTRSAFNCCLIELLCAGNLDDELAKVLKEWREVATELGKDIKPTDLEQLRKVKQLLVALESKADTLRY